MWQDHKTFSVASQSVGALLIEVVSMSIAYFGDSSLRVPRGSGASPGYFGTSDSGSLYSFGL